MRGENRTLLAVALWAVSLIEANAQVVSDVRVEIRAFDHKRETAKNIKIGLVVALELCGRRTGAGSPGRASVGAGTGIHRGARRVDSDGCDEDEVQEP
jgi:hypothetical protein